MRVLLSAVFLFMFSGVSQAEVTYVKCTGKTIYFTLRNQYLPVEGEKYVELVANYIGARETKQGNLVGPVTLEDTAKKTIETIEDLKKASLGMGYEPWYKTIVLDYKNKTFSLMSNNRPVVQDKVTCQEK